MKIKCPICRKIAKWEGNPFKPFCSERCKLIDLGEWLTERYSISEPVLEGEDKEGSEEIASEK